MFVVVYFQLLTIRIQVSLTEKVFYLTCISKETPIEDKYYTQKIIVINIVVK